MYKCVGGHSFQCLQLNNKTQTTHLDLSRQVSVEGLRMPEHVPHIVQRFRHRACRLRDGRVAWWGGAFALAGGLAPGGVRLHDAVAGVP